MANIVVFIILAVVILGSAVMCVMTKRIMRAATFLLFVLFGVAGIYFLLDYTFLGAAQIAVYAGGVTMIYIFAIQLVSKHALQGLHEKLRGKQVIVGIFAALAGFATVAFILLKNKIFDMCLTADQSANQVVGKLQDDGVSMETIGTALMGSEKYQYVLPFEFISIFLLACIIGGIVISRKDK